MLLFGLAIVLLTAVVVTVFFQPLHLELVPPPQLPQEKPLAATNGGALQHAPLQLVGRQDRHILESHVRAALDHLPRRGGQIAIGVLQHETGQRGLGRQAAADLRFREMLQHGQFQKVGRLGELDQLNDHQGVGVVVCITTATTTHKQPRRQGVVGTKVHHGLQNGGSVVF